jgi:hypothetical protein
MQPALTLFLYHHWLALCAALYLLTCLCKGNGGIYGYKLLIALDLFLCVLGWRDEDVTMSSEAGLEMRRPSPKWWARALYWLLDHVQKGHCEMAIQADIARARRAIAYLESVPPKA